MNNYTIFIAIEDKQVLSKIKILLEKDRYVTEGTDDGLKALNAVRLKRPALVILGDTLFRMDGFKVCRFLKFDEQFRSIPVIFLLSEQRKDDEPLAMEVGADCCLPEPFNAERLIEEIKKLTNPTQPL